MDELLQALALANKALQSMLEAQQDLIVVFNKINFDLDLIYERVLMLHNKLQDPV